MPENPTLWARRVLRMMRDDCHPRRLKEKRRGPNIFDGPSVGMPYPDDLLDYGVALRIMGFEKLGGRVMDQARAAWGQGCLFMEESDFPPIKLLDAAIERGKRAVRG